MLIMMNSTGRVKYVFCTERCLPRNPGRVSGTSPARSWRTTLRWPGMMMKKTFHTMIVPITAPTCRNAARAPKMWKKPQSKISKKMPIDVQSATSFFSKIRQSAS